MISELEEWPEPLGTRQATPSWCVLFCFVSCAVLSGSSPTLRFTDISKTLTTPPGGAQQDQGSSEMKAYLIVQKTYFQRSLKLGPFIPKPPFALDTIIASAVGEFRFHPRERMYQLIQRTLEIALPFSDVTLIP